MGPRELPVFVLPILPSRARARGSPADESAVAMPALEDGSGAAPAGGAAQ